MPESTPSPEEAGIRLVPAVDLGDTPALYANHVQVSFTPEDFTLHLGWYTFPPLDKPPDGVVDVPVRSLAKISLPLNLVRGVITALESQVDRWEKNWGTLQEHPNPAEREETEAK